MKSYVLWLGKLSPTGWCCVASTYDGKAKSVKIWVNGAEDYQTLSGDISE